MPRKIFISYRRDDAKAEARSIYQHLERVYGRDRLFMDVDSIQKGLDFTKVLGESLSDTAVMLVVMGRTWLSQQDSSGRRRLDDPADYVKIEVANALRRDISVIPVRVDGARLPRVEELPDDLKDLVLRQGTNITHESFDSDLRGLEADLRKIIDPDEAKSSRPWAAITAGIAAVLIVAAGGAMWAYSRAPAPSVIPAPTTAQSPITREAELKEIAAALLRQQEEERRSKDAEVRRRLEETIAEEARRHAEAETKRRLELARLEAEAEAVRKAHAEQERARQAELAKAEAEKARAEEKAKARRTEMAAAWRDAQQTNTLQAYLRYLREFRDGENRAEARARALPLLRQAIEEQVDARFVNAKRPDGTMSFYLAYPDNPRAAALCIDWSKSTPERIMIVSAGLSGSRTAAVPLAERETQAIGICQAGRLEGANCSCQIVRRNKESTTEVPEVWIARQVD